MSLVVHKYEVPSGEGAVAMPMGATLLHVAVQPNAGDGEGVYLWALVDRDAPQHMRNLGYFATGEEIPDGVNYVGTAIASNGAFVWHVFEEARS